VRKFIIFFVLISASLNSSIYEKNTGYIFSYSPLVYDDFNLNIYSPKWQPRVYYYGVCSSSIGYFHVNKYDGDISIYGSNRIIEDDELETFYESLQPFEKHLLPYATPNAGRQKVCRVLSEEDTTISGIAAKKVIFELVFPNQKEEIVISYLFSVNKTSLFSSKNIGYTYSISCPLSTYKEQELAIDDLAKNLRMR